MKNLTQEQLSAFRTAMSLYPCLPYNNIYNIQMFICDHHDSHLLEVKGTEVILRHHHIRGTQYGKDYVIADLKDQVFTKSALNKLGKTIYAKLNEIIAANRIFGKS